MFFGKPSYPSCELKDISAQCTDHGINAVAPPNPPEFDYIVVGGGTAGCVLANRLCKFGGTVLVLERGQFADSFQSRAPLPSLPYSRNDDGVLKYDSAPQQHLHGSRKIKLIAGKLLGGTSRINNGLYTRCLPAEFHDWGEGWTFDQLETLYNRSSSGVSDVDNTNSNGEWKARIVETFFESSKIFLDVIQSTGVPFVKDVSDPKQPTSSITKIPTTVTADGRRSSTSEAFLPTEFVMSKQNLKICFGAIVQRLDIDDENRVRGVYVETEQSSSETYYIKAKEVILCCGAMASPKLLMLSGIGPRAELEKHNIVCKVDLPGVGAHLQDHISVPLCYSVPIASSIQVLRSRPFMAIKSLLEYLFFGTGLFLSPITEYTYLLRSDRLPPYPTSEAENDTSRPENLVDLEISWISAWGTIEEAMPTAPKSVGFNSILVQVIRPKSKGTITIVDRDARNPPIVDPNYLSAESDLETMRKGVQYGLEIGRKVMEKKKDIVEALVPKESSTEAIDEFIRKFTTGTYHHSSTCRMAKREDNGVVDQSLQVYGVHGLRVADASIFPRLVGVKPQATVVLVAEKCADLISKRK